MHDISSHSCGPSADLNDLPLSRLVISRRFRPVSVGQGEGQRGRDNLPHGLLIEKLQYSSSDGVCLYLPGLIMKGWPLALLGRQFSDLVLLYYSLGPRAWVYFRDCLSC